MATKTGTTLTTDPERSRVMRAVKSANTTPELAVRRILWRAGMRYRLHVKSLPGTPDVVFPSRRIALFVHGCFWHRHPGCKRASTPKNHADYWKAKFEANVRRDAKSMTELEALGWRVVVIWECETRAPERLATVLKERVGFPATNRSGDASQPHRKH